jgi:hypothetical protein
MDRTTLFTSYARDDDEPFVAGLHRDLAALGFDVWWDRRAMDSRGRTFLQEIRDAIAGVDRVLLVVGPRMVRSEYVEAEWRHALTCCRVVVPLLRLGDHSLLPGELQGLHCPDFRVGIGRSYDDALAELARILRAPVPPLAALHGVDALPSHFVPLSAEHRRLTHAVLADRREPGAAVERSIVVVEGMGGVGKSVLAAAAARDCAVRRSFGDGIVWVRVGRDADSTRNLMLVGRSQGDHETQHYVDRRSAADRLGEILEYRNVLLVLDDVWAVEDVEPLRDALGSRGCLLITTRDRTLGTALDARVVSLEALGEWHSLTLLAGWSGQEASQLPAEARLVARECGHLPLALAMVGAMVRGRPDRWANVLHKLREADLDAIRRQTPNYPYPTLLRAIQVSVEALSPEVAQRVPRLRRLSGRGTCPRVGAPATLAGRRFRRLPEPRRDRCDRRPVAGAPG